MANISKPSGVSGIGSGRPHEEKQTIALAAFPILSADHADFTAGRQLVCIQAMRQFFLDQTAIDLKARAALLDKQIKALLSPLERTIDAICKAGHSATRITVILPDGQ